MIRIRLEAKQAQDRAVITVGSFDGLHIGHRAVVHRVKELAALRKGTSIVVTFDPHPQQVIAPDSAPRLLTSLEERSAAFERMDVDVMAVVPFTNDLRQLSPQDFVDRYLVEYLQAETIVMGYDHGFGRDRAGDVDTMKALAEQRGFDVVSVPPTLLDGDPVSSTRVRRHIELGEMEAASRLLGEGYPVEGVVVAGDGRGQKLGFPTANLALTESKLLPPDGVYAGWIHDEVLGARRVVTNLGTRPTFDGAARRFEAHILDCQCDLYGKRLNIALETRLRDERKFDGVEALKSQISEDIEETRRRLDSAGILMDAHNQSSEGG